MSATTNAAPPLLVVCLCARWCRTCDDYRPVFDALGSAFGARIELVWVDIEDDEAALGAVDVEDFPTLLLARADQPLFFGPITPHPATLARLVQSALDGDLKTVAEPALAGLPGRLRALRQSR